MNWRLGVRASDGWHWQARHVFSLKDSMSGGTLKLALSASSYAQERIEASTVKQVCRWHPLPIDQPAKPAKNCRVYWVLFLKASTAFMVLGEPASTACSRTSSGLTPILSKSSARRG